MKIKKGDSVKIITGKDKGKKGKVVRVISKIDKVVVEGINVYKKHQRRRKENEKGSVIDVAMPIHVSNVRKND
jgi:large subunit ribosomal protein L24